MPDDTLEQIPARETPPAALPKRSKAAAAIELMRPTHWAKNGFVLAPLLFAKEFSAHAIFSVIAATIAFCFISSAVYVLNDWFDRLDDAEHPTKCKRPLASGELSGGDALVIGGLCLLVAAGCGLAMQLPLGFWAVIGSYLLINVAYSVRLRHVALVDVLIIASGFVLRVLAGTTAIGVPASQFIVLASGLLALLLAFGKRRVDLGVESSPARRSLDGYTREFVDVALGTLGAAVIGFYAQFAVSDYATVRYHSHNLYLTTFFVVAAILRYLQIVLAHGAQSSPTEIAIGDRVLQATIAGWITAFVLIAYVL